jgi:hypothetical protein
LEVCAVRPDPQLQRTQAVRRSRNCDRQLLGQSIARKHHPHAIDLASIAADEASTHWRGVNRRFTEAPLSEACTESATKPCHTKGDCRMPRLDVQRLNTEKTIN